MSAALPASAARSARSARPMRALALAGITAALLAGCSNTAQRLSEVGRPPAMTPIANPVETPDYQPVRMPMPTPEIATPNANSLWRPGARGFFKDQRASTVGDILTVQIAITDTAQLANSTSQQRGGDGDSANLGAFLGYEASLANVLPEAVTPDNLINFGSSRDVTGSGTIQRTETVDVTVAAVVIQVLPNGNLVIAGRQEVRVNDELREMGVTGVIRPEDITSANAIASSQIAELRVSYGGRGTLSDVQRPRYGSEVFDIIFPF